STPAAVAIISFVNNGVRVSEAGVSAAPASTAFRLFAAAGLAITNTSNTDQNVQIQLFSPSGATFTAAPPINFSTATILVPGMSHVSMFVEQTRLGAAASSAGFMRATTSNSAGVSMIGLRSTTNTRGDVISTTTPAWPEDIAADTSPRYIT